MASPPKRPRLSLQIKALATGPSMRTSRTLAAVVNPRSPTSFNTLSNVYSTAIDRAGAAMGVEPVTAIERTGPPPPKRTPVLPRLQMPGQTPPPPPLPPTHDRTHTPYVATQFPETPLTALPVSPGAGEAVLADRLCERASAAAMTPTPPLSATLGRSLSSSSSSTSSTTAQVFCFSPGDIQRAGQWPSATAAAASSQESSSEEDELPVLPSALPSTLRSTLPSATPVHARHRARPLLPTGQPLPYVHPRSLHSILRNSPLPTRHNDDEEEEEEEVVAVVTTPGGSVVPASPRRRSQRLRARAAERAARHVVYNSPLEQTITTNRYTWSHVDLLSPGGGTPTDDPTDNLTSDPLVYNARDGGQTPGPFEEMRRRMAGLETATPVSGSGQGRGQQQQQTTQTASRDRKRRWVWTLGQDDEDEENLSGAIAALRAAEAAAKQKEEEEGESKEEREGENAAHDEAMQDARPPPPPQLPHPPSICTTPPAPTPAMQSSPNARKRKATPDTDDDDDDDSDWLGRGKAERWCVF